MQIKSEIEPTPPIGVIDAFGKGFESVLSQIALISIPLLLDLFLWLGPRLTVGGLFDSARNVFAPGDDIPDESLRMIDMTLESLGESMNLFSFLSTSPLGVPSMMVSKIGLLSPFGEGLLIPVTSWFGLVIVSIIVSLVGLFLGVVYFTLIGREASSQKLELDDIELIENIWVNWVRMIGFSVAIIASMFAFGFAISILAGLASIVHTSISGFVISLGVAIWVWGLFFIAFTAHGIIMDNYSINVAVRNSLLIVRLNMPSVIGLFSLIVLILWGLGYLWLMPSSESWILVFGIVAHSFVATGLYASTFYFYKDRLRWSIEILGNSESETHKQGKLGISRLWGKIDDGEKHEEKDKQ